MSSVLIHSAARSVALAVALIAVLAGCHARGPAPTEASVTGELGPFAIASATVAAENATKAAVARSSKSCAST